MLTRSRTTARSPTITRSASVEPANTIAPVETVQRSPTRSPGSGSRACGRVAAQRGALAQHGVVADQRPGTDRAAVVHDDVGAELDAFADRHVVAHVQVRPARVGAQRHAGSCTGRPPSSSDDCIAASTSTTARPFAAAAARLAVLADRIDELLALEAQRLVVRDARDGDVAEADADVLAVGVGALRPRDALVVDRHLAVGLHVVEDHHLLRADDRQLARLVRVEPAQVQVRDGARRELEIPEDDVLDRPAARSTRRAPGPRRAALRRGRAGRPRRARRGSRARSRLRAPGRGSRGCRRGSRCRRARPSRSASRTAASAGWKSSRCPTMSRRSAAAAAGHQLAGVRDARRERLLDEHVLARREGAQAERVVRRHARGDRDRVERRIVQQVVEVGREARPAGYCGA